MSSIENLAPLLIANRGEIAVRIARTAQALGLRTVGVFTASDRDALHVDCVDQAVRVDSYLNVESILAAGRQTGARAVHPGYGFLSENAAFAQSVLDSEMVWVGPGPATIKLMGDKAAAKATAAAAGVPVLPSGEEGGYPIVVKALAGGGGRGMRVVRSAMEFREAKAAAQREALGAFGDDRVMTERWIERPRHIEVQVLGDHHGTVIHLGERECSLQRRHQKVIEEAPSPAVSAAVRERLGTAAVGLAEACGYYGAGTVEFITPAAAEEFFFLEMNTRLQVEHPVTELIFGLDLVELQLTIAAGEPLPFTQTEVASRGHAIEARIYAEDPAAGFLPSTGIVRRYREPRGARIDSGIREGSEIGTQFDSLLAKVITHGRSRSEAIARLERALAELEVFGVSTNAAFSRALLAHGGVRAGDQDTGLLERVLESDELFLRAPEDLLLAGALAAAGSSAPAGPWHRRFEQGEVRIADGQVRIDEHSRAAEVRSLGDGYFAIELDGLARRYSVWLGEHELWVGRDGHTLRLRTLSHERSGAAASSGSLQAPMPGTVLQVRVDNGDEVSEGEMLVVLESMKMELSITAPHAGRVSGLELAVGDRVEMGQSLLGLTRSAGAP